MLPKKIHILIEQGLQQVGVFAYSDFTHEEIDLEINKQQYAYLNKIFNPNVYAGQKASNYFEFNQEVLDRISVLQKTVNLTKFNTEEDNVSYTIPSDYLHYIRSTSNVSPINLQCSKLYCNKVEPNKTYKILSGSILYKGVQYNKGDSFVADTESKFEIIPTQEMINVAEIKSKKFRNRLGHSYQIDDLLENSLTTSKINSPVCSIVGNLLKVYTNNFSVNTVQLLYCRKPIEVNFGTGTGLDFPDDVCYEIIDLVVTALSIDSEQNQQKIVNQIQSRNV